MKRTEILRFAFNLEENLFQIQDDLMKGKYIFGPYRAFTVIEPKKRLIEASAFKDRVIHHSLHEILNEYYEKKFYRYSYACRKNKGTHAAMLELQKWLAQNPEYYFLKCDIKKFFESIDRKILLRILFRSIEDQRWQHLIKNLIETSPRGNGIPIGNLTSQLFANVYLNELDEYIKRILRVKYYIRYMDDFICLSPIRKELEELRVLIQDFLSIRLNLILSPQKVQIGEVKKGVSFVGFRVFPNFIRLRSSSIRRFRKKIKKKKGDDLRKSLASFSGHASYTNTFIGLYKSFMETVDVCGEGSRGVIAGGNWNNGTNSGRFALNLNNSPSNTNNNIGARCAVALPREAKKPESDGRNIH